MIWMRISLVLFWFALATATAAEGVPAFKVTSPAGAESTLIGSMHIPYAGLRQPMPTVLDGATHLVIEHTTADEKLDLAPAPEVLDSFKKGETRRAEWAQFVTAAQFERMRSNLSCALPYQLPPGFLELALQAKSPRTAASFAYYPCTPKGKLSRDGLLEVAAAQRGVSVVALETQDEIERRRRQIPERLYLAVFKAGLAADLNRIYGDLIEAFNRGDFDSISRIAESVYADPSDRALFHQIMIGERNAAWMPGLRAALSQGRAVVIVGAAHLPGDDGLIAMLKQNGYRVDPINLPAAE